MERLAKQLILATPLDDNELCSAKVMFSLTHLENDCTAIALLKRQSSSSHEPCTSSPWRSRVLLGPCTFWEITQFEQHLNVQIVVFSSDNLNLHDNHYNAMKTLKAFFSSNCYCKRCKKSFYHIENHQCANACYICQRTTCVIGENSSTPGLWLNLPIKWLQCRIQGPDK